MLSRRCRCSRPGRSPIRDETRSHALATRSAIMGAANLAITNCRPVARCFVGSWNRRTARIDRRAIQTAAEDVNIDRTRRRYRRYGGLPVGLQAFSACNQHADTRAVSRAARSTGHGNAVINQVQFVSEYRRQWSASGNADGLDDGGGQLVRSIPQPLGERTSSRAAQDVLTDRRAGMVPASANWHFSAGLSTDVSAFVALMRSGFRRQARSFQRRMCSSEHGRVAYWSVID